MGFEMENVAENVASVEGGQEKTTEPAKTTILAIEGGTEDVTKLISLSAWPPSELERYPGTAECLLNLTRRFFPSGDLVEFISSELIREGVPKVEARHVAVEGFEKAKRHLRDRTGGNQWALRLHYIFKGEYPIEAREVWCNGRIATSLYEKLPATEDLPFTFQAREIEPISNPKDLLCSNIAPDLYEIEERKVGPDIYATPEVERFQNGDKQAVPRSCLREDVIYDRPTYGVTPGWAEYNNERLPRKIHTVEILVPDTSPSVVDEFITDLGSTFAWTESKTKETSPIGTYLSYLVQPIFAHICPGQMPAYDFMGPTKAGKGALSNGIPSFIYHRPGQATVITRKIPKETYEFDVLMNSVKHALFLCFDEVKNATDEELKLIDAFCTQTEVQVRKFRFGYFQLPNLYTVSLTAVHRSFSDETYGRLAVIQLKESRPDLIAEFFKKWRLRGPELLRGLFDRVSAVQIDLANIASVPDRRPGFGLMSHIIKQAFGMTPDFAVESVSNDILDDLCRMHEAGSTPKNIKGNWFRYSPRAFQQYMAETYELKFKKANAIATVNTALGYTSTRHHPIYKLLGYPAESGRHYHLEVREEGSISKRIFIYVQEVGSQSITQPVSDPAL